MIVAEERRLRNPIPEIIEIIGKLAKLNKGNSNAVESCLAIYCHISKECEMRIECRKLVLVSAKSCPKFS